MINDYKDRHIDKLHPRKKTRPIASGEVSEGTARILMVVLIVGGLTWGWFINPNFFYILLAYVLLNIGYSLGLKNIAILDLFIVASGFLLRVYSGGVIVGIPVTEWLAIMILLLSLITVTIQSARATLRNPASSLRTE